MEKNKFQSLANEAILASAGTGKTFTLAMRFLTLLHYGIKPSAILASTFTNKAAGEIFDKLIEELRSLTGNEEKIASLIKSGHLPDSFTRESAFALLRILLQGKEELRISTLDSFFLNIIRAFPTECGIHGEITLLEEGDTSLQDQALLHWIRKAGKEERALLREMVKNASFGAEQKSLYKVLQSLIQKLYSIYLLAPEKRLYGGYNPLLASQLPVGDILKEEELSRVLENFTERFLDALPQLQKNKNFSAYVQAFAEDAANLSVKHTLSKEGQKFWNYILRGNEDLFTQDPQPASLTFTYSGVTCVIEGTFFQDLLSLLCHIRALLLYRALERTKSIYNILEAFHKEMTLLGRSRGKITFSDIPYLLRPAEEGPLALPFSESAGIEERLDTIIDHYLLDEFQDTSDAQYRAMEQLLDEVVSDPSGARSFFYVGDIKQSIYQWREGNPGLFEMIYQKYLSHGDRAIQKKSLSLSFRSGESVLKAVNAVFEAPYIARDPLTVKAMEKMQFARHLSSSSAAEQKGASILYEIPSVSGADGETKARAIYLLLQKIDPFRRKNPLTVGILFRKNAPAKECAEYFRKFYAEDLAAGRTDLPPLHISIDGKLPTTESPLYALYSNLILLADHPGDPFARGYLELLRFGEDPLPPTLLLKKLKYLNTDEKDPETPLEILASSIRNDWDKGSFALFLERFLAAFREEARAFDLTRMEAVRQVTNLLETSGRVLSSDDYRALLEKSVAINTSLRGTIQMMTIHKSKGLDFDIVIMPELSPRKKNENGLTAHADKDETFHTRYITFLPDSSYAATFPIFRDLLEKEAFAKAYENCCNLYVGMTRARYALYLFAEEKSSDSKTYQQREILYETLGMRGDDLSLFPEEGKITLPAKEGEYDSFAINVIAYTGDPLWYRDIKEKPEKKENTLTEEAKRLAGLCLQKYEPGKVRLLSSSPAPEFVSPSSFHGKKEKKDVEKTSSPHLPALTFQHNGNPELGTRIHKIMENFSFSGKMTKDAFFHQFLTKEEQKDSSSIPGLLEGFFREDSPLYEALLPPENGMAELWKEKEFLLACKEEGKIFSGTFDRVHLIREGMDPSAPVKEAIIFDYKSDHLEKEEDFLSLYSRQMELYIAALEKMLSLPKGKVKAKILALYPEKVIEVKNQ